ncbi:cytochrome P450 [Cladorrhinum sp. PSN332]|nr:cytochrome P450 [Cladorrhinum sp. PSN332]
MSQQSSLPSSAPWADLSHRLGTLDIPDPVTRPVPYIVTAILLISLLYSIQTPRRRDALPHLNPRRLFEFTNSRAKAYFAANSRELVRGWFEKNPDKPVRVIADVGETILLPARLANEMKNDERLSFPKFVYNTFHAQLPGFDGFRESTSDSRIVGAVLLNDLTKHLNKVTQPISEETGLALEELLGGTKEWKTVSPRQLALALISRISSRVFLGEELCRDKQWLDVTCNYAVDTMKAAEELRLWPAPLRKFVHWFLPSCQRSRMHAKETRRIIGPILEKRRAMKARGEDVGFDDALEWLEREANGRWYDPAAAQLIISALAIHTTSDLLMQVLCDLVQHPEIVQPLREEMVAALRDGGWKKTSLYNMKLLDSVIKESQRMKPLGLVSMRRVAMQDVTLSDGTFIPKDTTIGVSAQRMWDSSVYPSAEKWDGYRFLKLRAIPGNENAAQLVTTSPDHLGFGHGKHSCPGRFFAGNEVKIALVHLLLKYDWRLPEGGVMPETQSFGFRMWVNPAVTMEFRRRDDNSDFGSKLEL